MNKGETLPYLAETLRKSKQWFKSNNEHVSPLEQAPPPTPFQTGIASQTTQSHTTKEEASSRMGKKDYSNAIRRLVESIPELHREHGPESMEVGETHYTIGAMHALQDQKKQALLHFEKSKNIFSAWLGKEHPRVWKLQRQMKRLDQ